MLGALLSALGGVAREASKAVEEVGERTGMPKWITGGISGGLSLAGDGLHAARESIPSFGESLAFIGSSIKTSFGGMISEACLPEPAAKCGRNAHHHQPEAPAVTANVPTKGYLDLSNGELFTLSAPQFEDQKIAIARGTGMSA